MEEYIVFLRGIDNLFSVWLLIHNLLNQLILGHTIFEVHCGPPFL